MEYARQARKPIVIERLDFQRKKAALEGESAKHSRMLSSFGYGRMKAYLLSRGYRQGVEVYQVNPAYSSVIGRVKFMERYGLSVHQAAALALARRLLGCREGIPCPADCSAGQWRSRHLQRTREEAREACVVVLGSHIEAAGTGACSAASAGHDQSCSGSGQGGTCSMLIAG